MIIVTTNMMNGDGLDPYHRLANAIIMRAAGDYRLALRRLRRHRSDDEALSTKRLTEKFFRSQWYGLLTGVSSEYMIYNLRNEEHWTDDDEAEVQRIERYLKEKHKDDG